MATAITGDTACMENDFDSDVFSECDSDSSDDLPLTDIISRIQDDIPLSRYCRGRRASDDDISEILTGDIDYEPSSDDGSSDSDSDNNDFGPGKSTDNDLSWSATVTQ